MSEKHGSSGDYDHLDHIKTDSSIRRFFAEISSILEVHNPNHKVETYLKEKVTKLQGVMVVLAERRALLRGYVTKQELRSLRNEKLHKW